MSLCHQLLHIGHMLHDGLRQRLDGVGLHRGQGRVLAILDRRGTLSQTEIAESFCRKGATVTNMLQHLEEQGLVKRVTDPSDARARLVSLTPAGRRAAARVHKAWDELESCLNGALSRKQAVELAKLLAMVDDVLSSNGSAMKCGEK